MTNSIKDCLDFSTLEKKVKGAYIFVFAQPDLEGSTGYKFRYFILSRSEFIKLIHSAQCHYVYNYQRNPVDKENYVNGVSVMSAATVKLNWLEKGSEKAANNHPAFNNPLNESCENKWENIWND